MFYVAAILGVLGFAVLHDTGTGHAYDRLKPGMSPTEVAALLGVPRSETKSGTRVVQVWRIADGFTIEVEFLQRQAPPKDAWLPWTLRGNPSQRIRDRCRVPCSRGE